LYHHLSNHSEQNQRIIYTQTKKILKKLFSFKVGGIMHMGESFFIEGGQTPAGDDGWMSNSLEFWYDYMDVCRF
jgi:hypothetical protein